MFKKNLKLILSSLQNKTKIPSISDKSFRNTLYEIKYQIFRFTTLNVQQSSPQILQALL